MILNFVENIRSNVAKTTISYLAATPKPRLVKLSIVPQGNEALFVAGVRYEATRFVVKVVLSGITGRIAPLIGKQPADTDVWILEEGAPAFVKSEGPLFLGGPSWRTRDDRPDLADSLSLFIQPGLDERSVLDSREAQTQYSITCNKRSVLQERHCRTPGKLVNYARTRQCSPYQASPRRKGPRG